MKFTLDTVRFMYETEKMTEQLSCAVIFLIFILTHSLIHTKWQSANHLKISLHLLHVIS